MSGIVSRILQGLAPIILARYLGPKEYGVYALVLSLVGIVTGVAHLGQNTALQKFLPEYSITNPSRGGAILAHTVILVSGALAILCSGLFFASEWIASALYHDASLTHVFQFSALLVLTLSLFNLASSATAGLQDFKTYSRAMIVRSAAFLGLGWLGVCLLGLYGALLGQLLGSLLGLALLTVAVLKLARQRLPGAFHLHFSTDVLREIFSFAFPALLGGLLASTGYWWANTLLARQVGFEQVGLFGVAFALMQLIILVPSNLSVPAVSFMSETYASAPREQFAALVSTNIRLIWALTLPLAVACAFFSGVIIKVFFGPSYSGATLLGSMMSVVALIVTVGSVIGNAVASAGRMWHALCLNAVWLLAFTGGVLAFVPPWAAAGLAAAFFLSYLSLAGIFWIYSRTILRIRYEHSFVLLSLTSVSAVVAVAAGRFLEGLPLFATGSVAVALTVSVEWSIVLSAEERSEIVSNIRRLIGCPTTCTSTSEIS